MFQWYHGRRRRAIGQKAESLDGAKQRFSLDGPCFALTLILDPMERFGQLHPKRFTQLRCPFAHPLRQLALIGA